MSSFSKEFIPLCVPHLCGHERDYVLECLDTNWVSSVGPFVDRFEGAFANKVGAAHAVSCVNGTAALHIAIQLAGVQSGEEVLVSTLTFIASANAIRYAGAVPVFVDAEPNNWQIDFGLISEFLKNKCRWKSGRWWNVSTDRPIGALLPVHVLGHPVDLDAAREIQQEFSLPVIEDAAEALGSKFREAPIGSHGNLACFSFNGNKIMTTGGGGMLVTDSSELADRARYLTTQAKDDPLEYIHNETGYNYRLSNILAALGYGQLEHIDEKVKRKQEIANRYQNEFSDLDGVTCFSPAEHVTHNCWLSAIAIDQQQTGFDCRALMRHLSEQNIQTRPLWQPLHLSKAFSACERINGSVSQKLYSQVLCLPCSTSLTEQQQSRVINEVKAFANANRRAAA